MILSYYIYSPSSFCPIKSKPVDSLRAKVRCLDGGTFSPPHCQPAFSLEGSVADGGLDISPGPCVSRNYRCDDEVKVGRKMNHQVTASRVILQAFY